MILIEKDVNWTKRWMRLLKKNGVFIRNWKNLSEQIRYIYQKRDYDASEDLPKAYHLISSIQEEGEWMVKNAVTHLENESEEHQTLYKKQVTAYEEELHQLKKERD